MHEYHDKRALADYVTLLRREARNGFAELDQGERIEASPAEVMAFVRAHIVTLITKHGGGSSIGV